MHNNRLAGERELLRRLKPGVIQEEMMKIFKIEAKMIVRPYLTIIAETKEEAKALYFDQKFDKEEFLETGFPISNLEIDEIYEEGHEPV
ncbi:MAG: hypothetical protein GY797_38020 [Deltaproteobacteria bacterium]|nr:hypothetical protein [Deltaproteobacteria bacterium]